MINDTIADLLTRIRNAQMAKHETVLVPATKMTKNVLDVLIAEGFIGSVEEKQGDNGFPKYHVQLKFYADGEPLINSLKRVSKPGCRVYKRVQDLEKIKSGMGVAIISTSQGVFSDREARLRNIGGEILAIIG